MVSRELTRARRTAPLMRRSHRALELIEEAGSVDNREYTVRLPNGSGHRSGRTYADRLENGLNSGGPDRQPTGKS